MGRILQQEGVEIRKHFDIQNKTSKCKLCDDEITIPGTHTGNLRKHLKRHHANVIEDITKEIKKSKLEKITPQSVPKYFQQDITSFVSAKKKIFFEHD